MHKYEQKENYIVRNPDPKDWIRHPNAEIMSRYSGLIKGSVLDFGCNNGACTFLIAELTSAKLVTGYDINQNAINLALATKKSLKQKDVNFLCGDFLIENFEKKFDTILTFHTLEHIYPDDLVPYVSKFYDLLNPDSHLIISIPYMHCYEDVTHVSFFTIDNLKELFETAGFKTIQCEIENNVSEGRGCLITGVFIKKD